MVATALQSTPAKAQVVPADTLAPKPAFTTDTLAPDSIAVAAPKGDIETTINYSARDSIRFEVNNKIVHLYGDAKIDYGSISLEAAYIMINWETSTLTATSTIDTTGKEIGVPLFKDAPDTYAAKRIVYNFKTRRGKISGAVTQQGEGYIHADIVKRNADNTIYAWHGKYTTCNLEDPHFYINATKMKVIPGDRVVSGPFNLVISDIPTPLGFVLGLFPMPKKRASGFIIPRFGETQDRGFFLREGGFYWAVNDYVGMKLTGDVYSFGGYGAQVETNYRNRYRFDGNLRLTYNYRPASDRDQAAISTNPSTFRQNVHRDFWIDWTHRPKPKPGGGQFSAQVRAGTRLNNRLNSYDPNNYLSNQFSSNISYSKVIQNTPFNYSINLRQDQNTQTGIYNFTLPDITFGMTQQNLFRLLGVQTNSKLLEDFSVGYSMNARNLISNNIPRRNLDGFNVENATIRDTVVSLSDNLPLVLDNATTGIQHNIPINLASIKIFNYFNLTPSINYTETWYSKQLDYVDLGGGNLRIDTLNRFSRTYEYNGGASLTTRIYGTGYVKGKKIEAIRHTIIPNLSYNYRPDFGDSRYNFYETVTDVNGNERLLSKYNNFLFGTPAPGLQSTASFSLSNNIEMKVRTSNDTLNEFKKVPLLERFGISSSYNFAADSFNLNNINLFANTTLFERINLNSGATFDPYQINEEGRRINAFEINGNNNRLARLTTANLSVGMDLNSDARRQQNIPVPSNAPSLLPEQEPYGYVDFNIPWNLHTGFSLNYSKFGIQEATISKSLNVDGSFTLTDNWKVVYSTGYDFENKNVTYTSINLHRDLHCWQMFMSWVPFGDRQSIMFTISAKASILQDLKFTRDRSWYNR